MCPCLLLHRVMAVNYQNLLTEFIVGCLSRLIKALKFGSVLPKGLYSDRGFELWASGRYLKVL